MDMEEKDYIPSDELYANYKALSWKYIIDNAQEREEQVIKFHESFPDYGPTPLKEIPNAASFGVGRIFVKEESYRFGLPSFKILGASWAIYSCLAKEFNLSLDTTFSKLIETMENLSLDRRFVFVCATDGNHGRAVAKIATMLGARSQVYVPGSVPMAECKKIESEGNVCLIQIPGDYDDAVAMAAKFCKEEPNSFLIQDVSFENYTEIPQAICDGYNTVLNEIDQQVYSKCGLKPSLVICGAGVGSFAQSVVAHYRSEFRENFETKVMIAEPKFSHTCNKSLTLGYPARSNFESGPPTIMDGLNCPSISSISFPILKNGLSFSLLIDDGECHNLICELKKFNVSSGPCGAAPYASFKKHFSELISRGDLTDTDVVVLISTEKERGYAFPLL
ncbi:uncharacterized protein PRCAT00000108001 [Priceomyces carsonii]|uniref:uncharacterized protein n=1 Tax=Priceomyces carsonii TaxID=28549 RepID=UPI002ED98CAA|nr:unnamed protein product [Priceomyces carsonii]